jgi:hypothetical protein
MSEGNVESGVVFTVSERLDEEQIEWVLFWPPNAEAVNADEWRVAIVRCPPASADLVNHCAGSYMVYRPS